MMLAIRTYFALLSILIVSYTTLYANSDRPPQRIVSLSPNVTEIIYGLGAWDKIAAHAPSGEFARFVRSFPNLQLESAHHELADWYYGQNVYFR